MINTLLLIILYHALVTIKSQCCHCLHKLLYKICSLLVITEENTRQKKKRKKKKRKKKRKQKIGDEKII